MSLLYIYSFFIKGPSGSQQPLCVDPCNSNFRYQTEHPCGASAASSAGNDIQYHQYQELSSFFQTGVIEQQDNIERFNDHEYDRIIDELSDYDPTDLLGLEAGESDCQNQAEEPNYMIPSTVNDIEIAMQEKNSSKSMKSVRQTKTMQRRKVTTAERSSSDPGLAFEESNSASLNSLSGENYAFCNERNAASLPETLFNIHLAGKNYFSRVISRYMMIIRISKGQYQ